MRSIALITGIGLLIVLVAAATAGGTPGNRSVTLHLVEQEHASNFVDNPSKQGPNAAPLIGDLSGDTSRLLTKSGAYAGHLETSCVATQGGPNGSAVCTGIFSLKGGLIVVVARVSFSRPTTVLAITGGTGAYEGVTGSGTSTRRSGNTLYSDDTLHLIWP